jgi:hypothetical protein
MDERVKEALDEQSRMETQRATFDSHWQEVAERVDPAGAVFTTQDRTPGEKRTEKLFDSTAAISLGRGAAAFESMVTPRSQKWHGLTTDEDDEQAVLVYLERFRDLLFRTRYARRANFANQNGEFIRAFMAYGNSVLFADDDPGKSLRYKHCHTAACWFAENHAGMVDRLHRGMRLTARQILGKFPDAKLPDRIVTAAEREPDRKFRVLHCVYPNPEIRPRGAMVDRFAERGVYVLEEEKLLLEVGGFRTMPYTVARYRVNAEEVYGRSPAMDVLPSIKTVNEQQKTNLRSGQRMADPPLLAYRDGFAAPFSLRGSSVNVGYLDEQGRPLLRPMETNANLPVSLEMQEGERTVIKDAFFVTLFQILEESPNKTATQVLEEVQQRGILMSPPVGRLQSEAYGQLIEREIDLLSQIEGGEFLRRRLGEMPRALVERGGNYEIEYDAPINRAQRAAEGIAILRTFEAATTFAQIDPTAVKVLKPRESLRTIGRINGMPAHLLATDDEIEAMDEDEAAASNMEQLLAAAPIAAGAAKDMAQAEALTTAGGAQRLPA